MITQELIAVEVRQRQREARELALVQEARSSTASDNGSRFRVHVDLRLPSFRRFRGLHTRTATP